MSGHTNTARRVEIIANQSIEEDVIDQLTEAGHGDSFTYLHPVYGRGSTGRREGSATWPETNVMFVVYLTAAEARTLQKAMHTLKEKFPQEGIKVWISAAAMEEL